MRRNKIRFSKLRNKKICCICKTFSYGKIELAELLELHENHLRVAIIKMFQEACLKQMKDRTSQQSTRRHKEEPIEMSEIQKHNNEIKHTMNEANKK